MNLRAFPKADLFSILETIQSTLSCKSERDLVALMERTKALVGGEFAICGLGVFDQNGLAEAKTIINASYPADWLSFYQENELFFVDPIVQRQYTEHGSQLWTDTYSRCRREAEKFIYDASCFGLKYGLTGGVREGSRNIASIITFSNDRDYFTPYQQKVLEMIAPHFHQALLRIYRLNMSRMFNLTKREREVLRWVSEGKTAWEVSMIMKISEDTARFHLKNIKEKLEAVSTTHAVAVALETGLIDLSSI